MKRHLLPLCFLAAALLGPGCVSPNARKTPAVFWSTVEPASVNPTRLVLSAGPFHLYHKPSIGIVNLDENYDGDDTPWIDRTPEFRQKIADVMCGYDPAAITLADVAVGRFGFLRERLGDDFVWKDSGAGDKKISLVAGNKWESIDKYSYIRTAMYPVSQAEFAVFSGYKEPAKGNMTIQVVDDWYRAPGTASMIRDVTVYLYGFRDDDDQPVPKGTFTQMEENLVRQLAVEGTERTVPDGIAVDVETPRGRFTMYRPSLYDNPVWRAYWLPRQDVWCVGKTLVRMLNGLPEEKLLRLQDNE